MLIAKNADICSKCLVTEPWVRSFIDSNLRRYRRLCQPQICSGMRVACNFDNWMPLMPSQAAGELEEEFWQQIVFASFPDAGSKRSTR